MHKAPIDDKDGLIVKLSITRKGNGRDIEIEHFLEDKHIQSKGELLNIAKKAVELLWETEEIKNI